MESPRSRKPFVCERARKRWRKNLFSRRASTISPGRTSSTEQLVISTTSSGQRVGNMLCPRTCNRKWPLRCKLSAARAMSAAARAADRALWLLSLCDTSSHPSSNPLQIDSDAILISTRHPTGPGKRAIGRASLRIAAGAAARLLRRTKVPGPFDCPHFWGFPIPRALGCLTV